jgi:hypothetical protein
MRSRLSPLPDWPLPLLLTDLLLTDLLLIDLLLTDQMLTGQKQINPTRLQHLWPRAARALAPRANPAVQYWASELGAAGLR